MKQILTLSALLLLSCFALQGQDQWSLERCVRHALENSLLIEESQIDRDFATVAQTEAQQSRFPSVNASVGGGTNFGRVINPSTNNFETDNSFFNNIGLNSGVTLFAANQINNSIKRSEIDLRATDEDLAQTKNDVALQVALAYLNVLFAEENLVNGEATLELSSAQLAQIDKLITAGSRPQSERYDILAQIALDEQNIVLFENTYDQNMLSLKHLLLLEPDYPLRLERPAISLDELEPYETYAFESVYGAALNSQPQIKAQELRIESAILDEEIARGSKYPSLSLNGSIGSNYSDLSKRALGFETLREAVPGVFINGESALFEQEGRFATGFETTPYFNQIDNNVGYGFSLNLSVPIYNNYRVTAGIERAKIGIHQQNNTLEQTKQTLKTNVQTALSNAKAAREALAASEKAVDAADVAYTHAQRRFTLGAINSFDLINAQNRLDQARVNVTIAKFDYLFKTKIIEYYLGRGLSLD